MQNIYGSNCDGSYMFRLRKLAINMLYYQKCNTFLTMKVGHWRVVFPSLRILQAHRRRYCLTFWLDYQT